MRRRFVAHMEMGLRVNFRNSCLDRGLMLAELPRW